MSRKKSRWYRYLADVLRDPVEGETRLVCNDVQILANLLSGLSKIFNYNQKIYGLNIISIYDLTFFTLSSSSESIIREEVSFDFSWRAEKKLNSVRGGDSSVGYHTVLHGKFFHIIVLRRVT
jgi:hypothetical protein